MEKILSRLTAEGCAGAEIKDGILTVEVPAARVYETASWLRKEQGMDFLMDMVGMDYGDSLGVIYYISNSDDPRNIVRLKTSTADRENPQLTSVADLWKSADLYEREVYDFFGIRFAGHPDMRRLFLRNDWKGFPFRKDYDPDPNVNPIPAGDEPSWDETRGLPCLTVEGAGGEPAVSGMVFGEEEYVVNFGPQHPAMHGVLHLRVSLDGETIRRVDPSFGYIHRGAEKLCEGYGYPQILHLTDRLDYLSGTMNRHAVCLCCEKALGMEIPERAKVIRTIFDELTRVASHLLAWGSMCMDMGAVTAFMYGMRDREKVMEIFEKTAGGRLMANYNVIGGVANDLHADFQKDVKAMIPYMRKMLKEHHMLFTNNPIARGRMKDIGHLSLEDAISIGATGPVGRASGWHNDMRKIEPYAAYDRVNFEEVIRTDGWTFDRYVIRLDEIEQSLRIIEQLIDNIPEGPFAEKTKPIIRLPEGEYFQRVENSRGQFCVHIDSRGDKTPYRVKFRSPSMTLVGALRAIVPGSKVADLIMLGGSLDYVIPCIDR